MLSTTLSRTSWENFFSNGNDLRNCDVNIRSKNNLTLLDKTYIKSFSIISRNSFVCDQIPTDECEVELVNYDTLSDSKKTYLTTHINDITYYVRVHYQINGVVTIGYKTLVVKSYKISRDGKTATFRFSSPLSCLSVRAVHFKFGVFTNDGLGLDSGSKGAKYKISRAELFPVRCLQRNKGIYYVYGSNTQSTEYDFKSFTKNTPDGNFSGINIIDDYDINNDEPDKGDIDLFSAIDGAEIDGYPLSTRWNTGSSGLDLPPNLPIDSDMYIKTFSVKDENDVDYTIFYKLEVYNDMVSLKLDTETIIPIPANTPFILRVKCAELSLDNPTNNEKAYLQSVGVPMLGDSYNSCVNYVRSYYSNNHIISFDCRIDPTLEPLDIIDVPIEGISYRVAIEEVAINFNGGFTGSIKGRILNGFYSIAFGTQPYNEFIYGNDWSFGGTVIASNYNGTNTDVTSDVTFSGQPTTPPTSSNPYTSYSITCSYTNNGKIDTLQYGIVYYAIGTPIVSGEIISSTELKMTVSRQSGEDLHSHPFLYIKRSDGQVMSLGHYYYSSSRTFTINEETNPNVWDFIKSDVEKWLHNQLTADVTCYFEVNSGNKTSEAVILQAHQ